MASRRRSGLATDRRAYGCSRYCPTSFKLIYNGNFNTSGNVPTDGSSPYKTGSTVTILGNSGSLAKAGYSFIGWNTVADGSGTSYVQGNTFTITANTTLYAKWSSVPPPDAPTLLSSVSGNQAAYILFTQGGSVSVTNYEYSTDNGVTFRAFSPEQTFSPVAITKLSSDGVTRLTNGETYTVKLKAVNSGASSSESNSVTVVPETTSLVSSNRIIHLDANNASSYSGSGTAWTNLDSGGAYSATLNGTPTFNDTDPSNKYFVFNPGTVTGQFAQINQANAINPVPNQPFTIQLWVRINTVGSQGTLVNKVFFDGESGANDGYALTYMENTKLELHENGGLVYYFRSNTGVLSSGWALYTANVQFGNGGGRQNKIIVNGRQVVAETSNDGISNSTKNLSFPGGGPYGQSNGGGFRGEGRCDIGEFYYYNTELTQTQIIQNYDATKSRYI